MRLLLVHAFLIAQILLPASYYLWRDDPNDERFAWRMFSSKRFDACSIRFFEGVDRKPIQAQAEMSVLLYSQMRSRQALVRKYAKNRCQKMRANTADPHLYTKMVCRRYDEERIVELMPPHQNLCE